MAKGVKWSDDYWLLLMQIYLQKPVGIKPMYSRRMVDLSLELHLPPNVLFGRMCQIANLETPRIEHIWETYGRNPRKLARAVRLWREKKCFYTAIINTGVLHRKRGESSGGRGRCTWLAGGRPVLSAGVSWPLRTL